MVGREQSENVDKLLDCGCNEEDYFDVWQSLIKASD
jgi:hypothetical protein